MTRAWTRRALLRDAAGLAAASALACDGAEPRAPQIEPLHLPYGGFAVGMQSYSLRHYKLRAALEAVAALGLSRVELFPAPRIGPLTLAAGHLSPDDSPQRVDAALAHCRRLGLTVVAHGVSGVPDAAAARALFAFAKRLGAPLLTVMPSDDALDELSALCAAHPEVRLGIHNHGPWLPWESADEIARALEGRPANFGACVDTGHYIRSGVDPAAVVRRLGPRVHGVHLKDFRSAGLLADGCVLGEGKLDLEALFAALRDVGFTGPISLEHEENADDVMPDLVRCLRAASAAAERVSARA